MEQAIVGAGREDDWLESGAGFGPIGTAMRAALPYFDGRLTSAPVSLPRNYLKTFEFLAVIPRMNLTPYFDTVRESKPRHPVSGRRVLYLDFGARDV